MTVVFLLLLIGFQGEQSESRLIVTVPDQATACALTGSVRYWTPDRSPVAGILTWVENESGPVECPAP